MTAHCGRRAMEENTGGRGTQTVSTYCMASAQRRGTHVSAALRISQCPIWLACRGEDHRGHDTQAFIDNECPLGQACKRMKESDTEDMALSCDFGKADMALGSCLPNRSESCQGLKRGSRCHQGTMQELT